MAQEAPKISPYSLPDLKNTTDDAIAPFLKSHSFEQSHTLTDVRLALAGTACLIAALCFYFDWTQGFEKTKQITLIACIIYFIVNTVLSYWTFFVESRTVYVGNKPSANITLTISSKVHKHDPTYYLTIEQEELKEGRRIVRRREVKSEFMNWFDEKGGLVKKPFETWLGGSIPYLLEYNAPPELTGGMATSSGRDVKETISGVSVKSGSVRKKAKK